MPLIDLSAPIRPDPPELPEVLRTEIEFEDHAAGRAGDRDAVRGRPGAAPRPRGLGDRDLPSLRHPQLDPRRRAVALQLADRRRASADDRRAPARVVLRAGRRDRRDRPRRRRGALGRRTSSGGSRASSPRSTSCSCAPGGTRSTSEPDYIARRPGVSAEATRWLHDQGVRVMGIDAWGWDAPLHMQAERGEGSGRARRLLGGPPGRPRLLPDRAARQPRRPSRRGVPGGLLPAEDRARQRRPRPRRRDRPRQSRVIWDGALRRGPRGDSCGRIHCDRLGKGMAVDALSSTSSGGLRHAGIRAVARVIDRGATGGGPGRASPGLSEILRGRCRRRTSRTPAAAMQS